MYDLAPRFPQPCQDESSVGPSSYFVSSLECKKVKEYTFPLSSTSKRFKDESVVSSPSPAHYFPKYRKHRILGGKSLQNTAARVCMVPKKKPTYSPYDMFQQQAETSVHFTKSSAKMYQSSLFKHWYSCRRSEISEKTKEIVLRQVSNKSLPDYLKFPGETSKASLKYRGSNWAHYTAKRTNVEPVSDTPGPGAYDILPKKISKPTKMPLTTEFKPRKCMSADETQPGIIEINEEDDDNKIYSYYDGRCDLVYNKISHNKSPFGIWGKSARFTYQLNENPAPWTYSPSEKNVCFRKIVKFVPFLACSSRFKIPEMSDLSPASYHQNYKTIKERTCEMLPKTRGALVAPFGSTAPRLTPLLPQPFDGDQSEPEQQDYLKITKVCSDLSDGSDSNLEESKEESTEEEMYQIVGTSLVLRDIEPEKPEVVNMREVYNNWKGKKSHRKPNMDESFLSSDYHRTEWIVAKSPAHDVDWPAEDNWKIIGGAIKMDIARHNENTKPKQNQPEYYDLHPLHGSSVYKPTHNYRLKTDVDQDKAYDDPDNVKTILKCFMPKEILNA